MEVHELSGSSVDGSLDKGEFSENELDSKISLNENQLDMNNSYSINGSEIHFENNPDFFDEDESAVELLLPSCLKVNNILKLIGFNPTVLTASDIDVNKRSISVFVIDTWAESLIKCLSELIDRQRSHHEVLEGVNQEAIKSDTTLEFLQEKIEVIKEQSQMSEIKKRQSDLKVSKLEQEYDILIKQMTEVNAESKKKLKNMSLVVEESQRQVKQKEIENDRLRDRIRQLDDREKSTVVKNAKALTEYRRGNVLSSQGVSNSPSSSSSVLASSTIKKVNSFRSHKKDLVALEDVVIALEAERDRWQARCKEYEGEIKTLSTKLKKGLNAKQERDKEVERVYGSGRREGGGNVSGLTADTSNTSFNSRQYWYSSSPGAGAKSLVGDGREPGYGDDHVGNEEREGKTSPGGRGGAQNNHDEDSGGYGSEGDVVGSNIEGRLLYKRVKEYKRNIESLNHKLEMQLQKENDVLEDNKILKHRNSELRNAVENLQLELQSRPAVSEWKRKLNEISEMEKKLHDVVMMRNESKEIDAWRKHLSTADRIKADRRNHELKLWVLETLPKTVMQDVLKATCRELDISDISDIQTSIVKLKAVVRSIPRMEKFISNICNFILQREVTLHPEDQKGASKPVMEDALVAVQKWWLHIEESQHLRHFQEVILDELRHVSSSGDRRMGGEEVHHGNHAFYDYGSGASNANVMRSQAIAEIKRLIKFQRDMFHSSKCYQDAAQYISERPDVMVNSILTHIQYLFSVNSVEGLLPRMNEVYLFTEEMRNFVSNVRNMLNMKHLPEATVLTQIYKRIETKSSASDIEDQLFDMDMISETGGGGGGSDAKAMKDEDLTDAYDNDIDLKYA